MDDRADVPRVDRAASTVWVPNSVPSARKEQWRGLGDQLRVDARIVVFERADAVTMPVAALFRDGDQWAVYTVHDGHAAKQRVKVGARTASDAWIEDGLAPGARVVVYPSDSVADGVRLKVVRGPQG